MGDEISRPRRTAGEAIASYRVRREEYVQNYRRKRFTPSAVAAPGRVVRVRGQAYTLAEGDALALVGALAQAVDGETARITLASGDVLELTHQEVSDLGRQLAGKPADEVSGSNRETGI